MSTKKYQILLISVCGLLIVLHVINKNLGIDPTTIGLLVLCSIPILRNFLTSIKAGGVELQFRELTVHQQIFLFLDGVASQTTWTFYTPRKGEMAIGQGFKVLIDELKSSSAKEDLLDKLKKWLKEGNDNHRYFAAEVIGYAQIKELASECEKVYKGMDPKQPWQKWELNCLWAHSQFQNYDPLIERLQESTDKSNREWIIVACHQMIREEEQKKEKYQNKEIISKLNSALDRFPEEKMRYARILQDETS